MCPRWERSRRISRPSSGRLRGPAPCSALLVLRSGNTLVVIQPEEVGHGRSIVVVAGGDVTRPGLAYRQVERATAILAHA